LRYIKYRHTHARVKKKAANRKSSIQPRGFHLFHRFTKELSCINAAFNFNQPCYRSFNGPLIIPEGLVAKPRAKRAAPPQPDFRWMGRSTVPGNWISYVLDRPHPLSSLLAQRKCSNQQLCAWFTILCISENQGRASLLSPMNSQDPPCTNALTIQNSSSKRPGDTVACSLDKMPMRSAAQPRQVDPRWVVIDQETSRVSHFTFYLKVTLDVT
jgi:hypothetical protein